MSKVWLVTGSASGLGHEITEAVLRSGDRLLATARDLQRLNDLVKRYRKQVSIAPLDVADEAAAKTADVPILLPEYEPSVGASGSHVCNKAPQCRMRHRKRKKELSR